MLSSFGGMSGFGRMFDEMQAMSAAMERQMAHELGGMRLDHQDLLEGLGGHGSFSRSSSSITRVGADGVPVTEHYSSTTRAAQGVTETNRSYRHSNGFEKLGVARTVGERGRRVVRTRNEVGEETCEDRLLGSTDGTAFDAEWREAAERAQLHRVGAGVRALPSNQSHHHHRPSEPPSTRLSTRERHAAREGQAAYAQQHRRMVEEARRQQRTTVTSPSQVLTLEGGGGGASPRERTMTSRRRPAALPPPSPPLSVASSSRGAGWSHTPSHSSQLARRFAQQEEQSLWPTSTSTRRTQPPTGRSTAAGSRHSRPTSNSSQLARRFAQEEEADLWR